MDGVIFALVSPLIIKDFALTVPEYRTGLQVSLFVGIACLYFWLWLADRYGQRTLLAIYVRATCPESLCWVRTQDRKSRVGSALAKGASGSGCPSMPARN